MFNEKLVNFDKMPVLIGAVREHYIPFIFKKGDNYEAEIMENKNLLHLYLFKKPLTFHFYPTLMHNTQFATSNE